MKKALAHIAVFLLLSSSSFAWTSGDSSTNGRFNFHFQLTLIPQYHLPFSARYTGQNSLKTSEGIATSITSTFYAGVRLWKGAEFYVNPEFAAGTGLSSALGVAGFPNGETFRIGEPKPSLFVARIYFKQVFSLSKEKEQVEDDQNQVPVKMPKQYISFAIGKFSAADFFDDNKYSHDPRTQFMNWALMSNGAWDYPANTRGYTYGFVVEYGNRNWQVRFAETCLPTFANGPTLELNLRKAHSETIELQRSYSIKKRKGIARLLLFYNQAQMGNYREATRLDTPSVKAVEKYGNSKFGFGINMEQEITDYLGAFARGSWNDGRNETWAFTEIDHSASAGFVFNGSAWNRKCDEMGIAVIANGISPDHRAYLAAGGYGFIIGDGKLNYAPEFITELYFSIAPFKKYLWISPDYQFILHPAYNKDRGPVHVFALRLHIGF